MTMKTIIIAGVIVLIWAGSLWQTYAQTREKWYDLGQAAGESSGKAQVLQELCTIGQDGAAPDPVTLALGEKSLLVDITGENGALTVYCR